MGEERGGGAVLDTVCCDPVFSPLDRACSSGSALKSPLSLFGGGSAEG